MSELLRSQTAPPRLGPGSPIQRVSVLLSGEVAGSAGSSRCIVRGIRPDGVQFETDLRLDVGDHVRLTLGGERQISGIVARREAGKIELSCKLLPDWARLLCKSLV